MLSPSFVSCVSFLSMKCGSIDNSARSERELQESRSIQSRFEEQVRILKLREKEREETFESLSVRENCGYCLIVDPRNYLCNRRI